MGRKRKYDYDQIMDLKSKGISDYEIAKAIGCSPKLVLYAKRKMGFKINDDNLFREAELDVLDMLQKYGHECVDMNEISKASHFDILVDGQKRIDVKSSRAYKHGNQHICRFQFANRKVTGCKDSEIYFDTGGKCLYKRLDVVYDFLILCAYVGKYCDYYVIPVSELRNDQYGVTLVANSFRHNSKYRKFRNAFYLLRE